MRIRLLAAALGTAAALTACGSSDTPGPTGPTTEAPPTGHGSYAACLAEHGVATPPAGPGAPPGVDADTWAKASAACSEYAPGPSA